MAAGRSHACPPTLPSAMVVDSVLLTDGEGGAVDGSVAGRVVASAPRRPVIDTPGICHCCGAQTRPGKMREDEMDFPIEICTSCGWWG